jgi:molybdopterin synthase sulfur carrier subunit
LSKIREEFSGHWTYIVRDNVLSSGGFIRKLIEMREFMDQTAPIPTVPISIPPALRSRVGGHTKVMAAGRTIRELIDALEQQFPGLRFNLCYETGQLRPYVNIFLNSENIRYLQGLDTPLSPGATLAILPSVAGG